MYFIIISMKSVFLFTAIGQKANVVAGSQDFFSVFLLWKRSGQQFHQFFLTSTIENHILCRQRRSGRYTDPDCDEKRNLASWEKGPETLSVTQTGCIECLCNVPPETSMRIKTRNWIALLAFVKLIFIIWFFCFVLYSRMMWYSKLSLFFFLHWTSLPPLSYSICEPQILSKILGISQT